MKSSVLSCNDMLPQYWSDYLSSKLSKVKLMNIATTQKSDVFVYFTDFHYPQSDYSYLGYTHLPNILRYIGIPQIVFGGDILHKHDTKEEAMQLLDKFANDFSKLPMYPVFGNHDSNPSHKDSSLTENDVYEILYKRFNREKQPNYDHRMYYYFDNKDANIRYIVLNTHNNYGDWLDDSIQHQWFINTLNNTPSNCTLVIFLHIYFTHDKNGECIESETGTNIRQLLEAYKNRETGIWNSRQIDFTNSHSIVACIVTGHVHKDFSIVTKCGFPVIGVTCDAINGSSQGLSRTICSYQEHAFDIIYINTESRTISCIRIGNGKDRYFTY